MAQGSEFRRGDYCSPGGGRVDRFGFGVSVRVAIGIDLLPGSPFNLVDDSPGSSLGYSGGKAYG